MLIISSNIICTYSQSDTLNAVEETYTQIIENTVEEHEEESDNYISELDMLRENPIDINTADIFELQRLPYITADKAKRIIDNRKKYGRIFSINELAGISGFDSDIISAITPFATAGLPEITNKSSGYAKNKNSRNNRDVTFRSRMILPLQMKKGFREYKYSGTPFKNYNRLHINLLKYGSINFLTDKDEGEAKLNDFTSFNLSIKRYYFLNSFILGDYYVEAGQGLALWGSYSGTAGIIPTSSTMKNQRNLVPYNSSGESGFFRGSAISFSVGEFNLSLFYSGNKIDANIDSSTNTVSSIKPDGYHRTITEQLKIRNTKEMVLGSVAEYYSKNLLKTGFVYCRTKYDKPIQTDYGEPASKFEIFSFYYYLYLKPVKLSGEAAYDLNNIAVISNLSFYIAPHVNSLVSFRYYSPFYNSMHGLGYCQGSNANNEIGFYTGLSFDYPFGKFLFYFDSFKHPLPVYNSLFPTKGYKTCFSFISRKFSDIQFSVKYNYSQNEQKATIGNLQAMINQSKNKFRLELKKYFSNIVVKSRIDFNWIYPYRQDSLDYGFMILNDLIYAPFNFLKLYGRIILFRTKTFETAVYEYENDMEGLFKSCALFGNGVRWYFMLKITPFNPITISLKYSETYKPNIKYTGSGYSEIEGGLDNVFGLQIDAHL